MQMTAGNQAVGRAIAEGRISPDSLAGDEEPDAPARDEDEPRE
jgi:hypothetical protein